MYPVDAGPIVEFGPSNPLVLGLEAVEVGFPAEGFCVLSKKA
jgi:hypothetical protein